MPNTERVPLHPEEVRVFRAELIDRITGNTHALFEHESPFALIRTVNISTDGNYAETDWTYSVMPHRGDKKYLTYHQFNLYIDLERKGLR